MVPQDGVWPAFRGRRAVTVPLACPRLSAPVCPFPEDTAGHLCFAGNQGVPSKKWIGRARKYLLLLGMTWLCSISPRPNATHSMHRWLRSLLYVPPGGCIPAAWSPLALAAPTPESPTPRVSLLKTQTRPPGKVTLWVISPQAECYL